MSGIYIPGMELPTRCAECPCYYHEYHECNAIIGRWVDGDGTPPKDCPLIPVPDHGRLIDADALMETFRERKRPTLSDGADGSKERVRYLDFISTLQAIKAAPTIIPAEES